MALKAVLVCSKAGGVLAGCWRVIEGPLEGIATSDELECTGAIEEEPLEIEALGATGAEAMGILGATGADAIGALGETGKEAIGTLGTTGKEAIGALG